MEKNKGENIVTIYTFIALGVGIAIGVFATAIWKRQKFGKKLDDLEKRLEGLL